MAIEAIRKALEVDMTSSLTAIDHLKLISGGSAESFPLEEDHADWILSALVELLAAHDALKAENERLKATQNYLYIGRDGKPVQARALEDRAEAAEAEVKRLREKIMVDSTLEITPELLAQWPPLKKSIWNVVVSEKLNGDQYVNAWELTSKLYNATLTAFEACEKDARRVVLGDAAEAIFVMGAWSPHYEKLTPNTFDEGTSAAYEIIREMQGEAEKRSYGASEDEQPRYTTKRMRDEIEKAKAYARREALEEAAKIADQHIKAKCLDAGGETAAMRLGATSIAASIRNLQSDATT